MYLNNKGFSLVEILMALGLMGVVAVAGFKIAGIQNNTTKTGHAVGDYLREINRVRSLLNNPSSCEKSFRGKTLPTSGPTQVNITSLRDGSDAEVIKVNDKVGNGGFIIQKMSLGAINLKTGRVPFNITYRATTKIEGRAEQRLTFHIQPIMDGTKIKNCNRAFLTKSDTILKKMCNDLQGKDECDFELLRSVFKEQICENHGDWIKYDPATKKCMRLDANRGCPGTELLQGFDDAGKEICIKLDRKS